MKTLLTYLALATLAHSATGDFLFQKKTSTGYAPVLITPENGKVISWSGGAPVNVTAGSDLAAGPVRSSGGTSSIADSALSIGKTSGLQTALDLKAPLASPAITGTPTINGTPVGTAATASSGDFATAAQGTLATNAQPLLKGVVVTNADGTREAFAPSADTDTARGLALEAAFADPDTGAGDTIDLSPGNYLVQKYGSLVGGVPAQFAILDKMTIRLNGARLYRTTAEQGTHTAGAFVVGAYYRIGVAGTTDFTLIGAANSSSNTMFYATGVGSGTGTATRVSPVMFSMATTSADDWSLLGPGIIEGTTAATAGAANTTGYEIGVNVGSSPRRFRIADLTFRNFLGAGVQFNSGGYTGHGTTLNSNLKISTGHISNCNFNYNNLGVAIYGAAEFSSFTNCTFDNNLTGADLYGANVKFVGCEVAGNSNYGLRIRNNGVQDGHGEFVGGHIVHNVLFAIYAEASMDLGFLFCGVTFGSDSTSSNKIESAGAGITLSGCYIDSPFYAGSTPTGINSVIGCFFPMVSLTAAQAIADLSTAERLKWKFANNYTTVGPYANNDAYAYVYADNTAALAGGLIAGERYRTSTGETRIVY